LIDCMLQRDPKRRATVELIQGHDWLQGVDPSPATKLTTPLVSYRSLSEEEHGSIIQRMALGGIADRDTVTEALESDQYNHITATYFLLAERILREKQERDQNNHTWSSPSHKAQFRYFLATRVDVHQDMGDGLGGTLISHPGGPQSPARSAESLVHHGPRPKTSLLELNHRREHQDRGLRPPVKPHSIPLRLGSLASPTPSKPRSPSLFSLDEEEEDEEDEEDSSPSLLPSQVVLRHNVASSSSSPSSVSNRLTSRKSAPVLNQIHEEEGEEEEPEQAFLSLHTGILTSSGVSSPATVTKVATVAMASPTSERRDDNDSVSQRRPDMDTTGPRQGRPSFASGGGDRGWSGGDRGRESPSADGTGAGLGSAKAASGLVESLKLMSLCLSSQFHSLTAGGGGVRGGSLDHQDQPVWRMCMGGSTGSLDKVSLLGGPSPGGTHHLQHHPLDHFADPQEHHQNLKNRVLQMPLSDKTMSVNIHRSPKEGLLCPPSPHSCCQVI
ncbi:unnamed protein product, partial [Oncorhynchus mykiss]